MEQIRKNYKRGPFRLRYAMIELDEYLRVFIIPQIPAEYKEYRDVLRQAMDRAWHLMYYAALTEKRERQKRLLEYKVEMIMVSVYLQEIRDVCYRGKMQRNFNKATENRFRICAERHRRVMEILWSWIDKESKKMNPLNSQKTTGLKMGN